jgi:hypothetical protein
VLAEVADAEELLAHAFGEQSDVSPHHRHDLAEDRWILHRACASTLRGLFKPAQAISDLRDKADGAGDDDQGIGKPFMANIVPTDQNGIAFSRTPQQVLSIVYLGGSKKGGFFPNGLNGTIS